MHKYGFNLLWSDADHGFIVSCPDFPGLSAFGATAEEALAEGKVALDLFIESLQESGDVLPVATQVAEYSGQIRLRMPKSLHSALARRAEAEGVSLNTWLITLLSERNSTQLVDTEDAELVSKTDSFNTTGHPASRLQARSIASPSRRKQTSTR